MSDDRYIQRIQRIFQKLLKHQKKKVSGSNFVCPMMNEKSYLRINEIKKKKKEKKNTREEERKKSCVGVIHTKSAPLLEEEEDFGF